MPDGESYRRPAFLLSPEDELAVASWTKRLLRKAGTQEKSFRPEQEETERAEEVSDFRFPISDFSLARRTRRQQRSGDCRLEIVSPTPCRARDRDRATEYWSIGAETNSRKESRRQGRSHII